MICSPLMSNYWFLSPCHPGNSQGAPPVQGISIISDSSHPYHGLFSSVASGKRFHGLQNQNHKVLRKILYIREKTVELTVTLFYASRHLFLTKELRYVQQQTSLSHFICTLLHFRCCQVCFVLVTATKLK